MCALGAGRSKPHLPSGDAEGVAAMHATGYRVDLEWWMDGESCCLENCAQPPMNA
ncbi:hypothetical protein [Actinomadura chokoriensis]|uniref:Uncharacterized protein n=1 Tax=Actinomadura chokoriensis TaxID=454156 RepID=A0ABV4QZV8_9ACTN